MDDSELHSNWEAILVSCRQIPAESLTWDSADAFIEAIRALVAEKRAVRGDSRNALSEELAKFQSKHAEKFGHALPPGAANWTVGSVEGSDAEKARETLLSLEKAWVKAGEARIALGLATWSERAELKFKVSTAEAAVDKMISALDLLLSPKIAARESTTEVFEGGKPESRLSNEAINPSVSAGSHSPEQPDNADTPSLRTLEVLDDSEKEPNRKFSDIVGTIQKRELLPNNDQRAKAGVSELTQAAQSGNLSASSSGENDIASGQSVVLAATPEPAMSEDDLTVPTVLESYEEFRTRHWIRPDGQCETAPWIIRDFAERIGTESKEALERFDFAKLWIYGRAADECSVGPLVLPDDVRDFAALWTEPSSPSAGLSLTRADRLRKAMDDGEGTEARWVMSAFLESIRPSLEQPLNPEDLAEKIVFESRTLHDATIALLRLNQGDTRPLDRLRAEQTKSEPVSAAELAKRLLQGRQAFQKIVQHQWSAAAGRIRHSHCRRAWKQFMDREVHPLAVRLQPSTNAEDHTSWNIERLRRDVSTLVARHDRIADSVDARYADRSVMNRTAEEIAAEAFSVIQTATELRNARVANPARTNTDLASLRPLLESPPLGTSVEEACRHLFVRLVRDHHSFPSIESLGISIDEFIERPWLAPCFERGPMNSEGILTDRLPLTAILQGNHVRAAAALMTESILRLNPSRNNPSARLSNLQTAIERSGRRDLHAWFLAAGLFSETEKTRIHAYQSDQEGALDSRLQELRSLWREIDELGLAFSPKVNEILNEADGKIDDAGWLQREMPLFDEWLRAFAEFLRGTIEKHCAMLAAEASKTSKEVGERVLTAIKNRHFSDALEAIHRRAAPVEMIVARETLWREDASTRWPNPIEVLSGLRLTATGAEAELLELWCSSVTETRKLRGTFFELISGESRKMPMTGLRTSEPSQLRILVHELLHRLETLSLNPTFVPQLRVFSQIVLMSPSVSPANLATYANSLIHAMADEAGKQHLVVFLAPGLSKYPAARDLVLREIRTRSIPMAVIDDLDLCRLLAPKSRRPNGFLGLVEFAFEQMDWMRLQPFTTQDGQFIQAEMFVGRGEQAEKLATMVTYSRIFSGRKLGKSALLKHLEMSRSGKALPSGSVLRVLYLNAAGATTEQSVVDKILERISEHLLFNIPTSEAVSPGERLSHATAAWTVEEPRNSLLVILDEADSFVEAQINDYIRDNERSLSFAMMKSIPDRASDNRGLPRVRFLLAGYRATNRDEGVWANAGQVLRLEPLSEEEAIRLIEGPLARLNVDAREQAPAIARRCGYQPAVLLRFGEALLGHLQGTHSKYLRGKVSVLTKDVADVFNSPRVQEEIRTVVNNNFHANLLGAVVWSALLFRLRRLPPGLWLENAAEEVLAQLKEIDPDVEWIRAIDPNETPVIVLALRDFRARRLILLKEAGNGLFHCQLCFPHYLPVLTREAGMESSIRQNIEGLRAGAQQAQTIAGLLPVENLEEIRRHFLTVSEEWPVLAIVAGAHWPAALQHEYGGIPDQLGLTSREIHTATDIPTRGLPTNNRYSVCNATSETLKTILDRPENVGATPPLLLGGISLLREALKEEEGGDRGLVMAFGLHRLNAPRLTWWFERLRAWQFGVPGTVGRILESTSGIPILVRVADQFLEEHVKPGSDVSTALCNELMSRLAKAPKEVSIRLADNASEESLSPREIQVLKMAVVVARNTQGFPNELVFAFQSELGIGWELYQDQLPDVRPLEDTLDDRVALRLLRFAGLLPLTQAGHFRGRRNDALYNLAAEL